MPNFLLKYFCLSKLTDDFFPYAQVIDPAITVCQNRIPFKYLCQNIDSAGYVFFCEKHNITNCVWQNITIVKNAVHFTTPILCLYQKTSLILEQKTTFLSFSVKMCRSKYVLLIPFRKYFFFLTKYNPIKIFRRVFEIITDCS